MLLRGGLCLLGLPVLLPDYWMIIICGRRGSVTPEHVPLARLKFCTAKLLPSLHSPEARNHPSLVWVDLNEHCHKLPGGATKTAQAASGLISTA